MQLVVWSGGAIYYFRRWVHDWYDWRYRYF
jgi:hypothetical protein